MADTMNFDLVSPERSLASFAATEVLIPGSEGDMTAMFNHAPILTTLRPGLLLVSSAGGVSEYVVTGGFAEVTPEGVTVIAERAMVKSDVTQADMDGIVSIAQVALDGANEVTQDAAIKMHADVVALAAALGLNAA
jgi:F-type H+-transporting ATPase subunit epsilon|tara:strand:- start:31 stop:438 length:408 start_codon:yes stop_codon:yes gene_type:complete